MRARGSVCGIELAQVVAAAPQRIDILERHVRDQRAQLRIELEEMRLVVGPIVGAERLVLPVGGFREPPQQRVMRIAREQRIPIRAPEHLDDVPSRAGEQALEFLDDLAVAAHRPIEALQIAIDDEGQVVEPLARRQRQRPDRFRLIHLAVAEYAPDVACGGVRQVAVREVAHEARLVDGVDRTDAHRAGGELPEIGHQPGMGIGAQTAAADFVAKMRQLFGAQAPLEKCARVDPGGRVRLEEHQIAVVPVAVGAKEMIEADFEDLGGRGIAGHVSAEFAIGLVGAHDHRQRIPAQDRGDALLEGDIARMHGLLIERDGVSIGGVRQRMRQDVQLTRLLFQLRKQEHAACLAVTLHYRFERFEPFPRFLGIGVERFLRGPGHRCSPSGTCEWR